MANNFKTCVIRISDCTGKSLSEALIFGSTNPQYEDRFFIESQVQYMKIPSSEQFLYTTCSPYVLQKRRASDKDLPVTRDSLIIICLA